MVCEECVDLKNEEQSKFYEDKINQIQIKSKLDQDQIKKLRK